MPHVTKDTLLSATDSAAAALPPMPLDGLRAIICFMSPARRKQMWLSFTLMLLGGLAEMVTISAVLPFLALLADPEGTARVPAVAFMFRLFGLSPDDGNVLGPAVVLLIAAAAVTAGIRILLSWTSHRFVLQLGLDMGVEIYSRMLRQPYSYHVQRNSSELIAGIEKVQIVIFAVLLPLMQAVVAGLIALFIIGVLIAIDPRSALLAGVSMGVVYLTVSLATRRILTRNARLLASSQTERVKLVQEGLGGIRDILIDQSQPIFEQGFRRLETAYRSAQAVNAFLASAPRFVVESTGIILIALLALFMSQQPGGLVAAIPIIGALALGAQRLLPLLQLVYTGWSQYSAAGQALIDVMLLLRAPVSTIVRRDARLPPRSFRDCLTLSGVGFRYANEGPEALKDVDLSIERGKRVGFVGKTGSGKSTLLDLLMGLLEPQRGEIRIDGRLLDDRSRADWQAQIAHVPQFIYLSDNSIAANIAFGEAPEAIDMDLVRTAAEQAQIEDFLAALPHGYNTVVGERGVRLSGGQRQRIGIARALYKRAPVLILDEATSALDDKTEAVVMAAIYALGRDTTVIVIAHRLTTLAGCDFVVRMEQGRVAEVGPYQQFARPASPRRKTVS